MFFVLELLTKLFPPAALFICLQYFQEILFQFLKLMVQLLQRLHMIPISFHFPIAFALQLTAKLRSFTDLSAAFKRKCFNLNIEHFVRTLMQFSEVLVQTMRFMHMMSVLFFQMFC